MASFKNIEKNTSENATYAAYKKLTSQDVAVSSYVAKKQFTIQGADFQTNGIFSFLFLNNSNAQPANCTIYLQGYEVVNTCTISLQGYEVENNCTLNLAGVEVII